MPTSVLGRSKTQTGKKGEWEEWRKRERKREREQAKKKVGSREEDGMNAKEGERLTQR